MGNRSRSPLPSPRRPRCLSTFPRRVGSPGEPFGEGLGANGPFVREPVAHSFAGHPVMGNSKIPTRPDPIQPGSISSHQSPYPLAIFVIVAPVVHSITVDSASIALGCRASSRLASDLLYRGALTPTCGCPSGSAVTASPAAHAKAGARTLAHGRPTPAHSGPLPCGKGTTYPQPPGYGPVHTTT